MVIQLKLKHASRKDDKPTIGLWVDACEVARMRQANSAQGFAAWIRDQIKAKFPQAYFNYDWTDWELTDHFQDSTPAAVAA